MSRNIYRLAVLNSHPIQYFAPLYRRIAQEPEIDLTVYYCSRQGVEEYVDSGFDQRFKWDTPLLEGYRYKFLPNWRWRDQVGGFTSLINPEIMTEVQRARYDAFWVHGHSYVTHLLAIAAAKWTRTPVMMRCETHLLLRRKLWKQVLRRTLMSGFYWLCDACLPIGTRNAEFYRHHGVPNDKLFSVPYTVDNKFFITAVQKYRTNVAALKQELGIAPDRLVVLYASKLTRRKRPMDLLQAYHQLEARGLEAMLLFVGSGEEEVRLREYSAENGLRAVRFLGFQNQTMLPKFYALADIFVLPSEDEPWGLIINEVMCAGLPVIATYEIGAATDLVQHGENGFLFNTGDIQALSNYLAQLCNDRATREKMGARSLEIIRSWSYEQCVEGIKTALMHLYTSRTSMIRL